METEKLERAEFVIGWSVVDLDSLRQHKIATMTGGKRSGPRDDGGRAGGRARVPGYERKINKKKDLHGNWKTVKAGTRGSVPDSYLHRYARAVGFRLPDEDTHDVENNEAVREAVAELRDTEKDVKNRINSQADFECFVLQKCEGTAYHSFLTAMMDVFDLEGNLLSADTPQLQFTPPTHALVNTWLLYLRNERELAFGGIEALLSGLSALNGQYSGSNLDRKQMTSLLKEWKNTDIASGRTKQAPTFDIEKDLPKLFIACFKVRGWIYIDCVIMWATFLVMMAVIGRASCMSTYSPLIQDLEFPGGPGGYDIDGLPKCIHIPWRDWKHRKDIRQKYFVTIYRNYTDPRFCPVFWLMYMLTLRKKRGDRMVGKLFPYKDSNLFQRRLKTLFKKAGLNKCSSHSVRRTAGQWAIRCGVDLKVLVDVGRWIDFNEARRYVGQGQSAHRDAVHDSVDGKDPVGRVWFFRSGVRSTPGGEMNRL